MRLIYYTLWALWVYNDSSHVWHEITRTCSHASLVWWSNQRGAQSPSCSWNVIRILVTEDYVVKLVSQLLAPTKTAHTDVTPEKKYLR